MSTQAGPVSPLNASETGTVFSQNATETSEADAVGKHDVIPHSLYGRQETSLCPMKEKSLSLSLQRESGKLDI